MKSICNFIFEIETLKSIPRSGSAIARVKNPDTIAEHVLVASQIAFIIAKLEGGNAEKCACIILFHDNPEVRIGDIHKIMARYLDSKEGEKKAHHDQVRNLPTDIQLELQKYFIEYSERKSKEAKICYDADLLECAFQAKIYLEQGYHAKQDWLDNISAHLITKSAKKIFEELEKTNSDDWWQGLKKIR